MGDQLQVLPVTGMGEIRPGTDLAEAIMTAAPWLRTGDVLVVTSKIVSKAEGRLVDVPADGPERDAARDEIVSAETARPVARRGQTRIVQTHHGFVMASAGVDASNVERTRLVLLPKDPDASARALRASLRERYGRDVAVIVSDTMGRPWRNGLTDVALGVAGMAPIRDHRGEIDPYGNELHITQMAVADELSSAAELVKGKRDQVPVAVVRGFSPDELTAEDGPGAAALIRDAEHDLFSLGTSEARADGLRAAAELANVRRFADKPVADVDIWRAVRSIGTGPGTVIRLANPSALQRELPENTTHVLACGVAGGPDAARYLRLGEDIHRLRCALAAAGLAATWLPGVDGFTRPAAAPDHTDASDHTDDADHTAASDHAAVARSADASTPSEVAASLGPMLGVLAIGRAP